MFLKANRSTNTPEVINQYLSEIGTVPLLTPEEEKLYGEQSLNGSQAAKNKLIESNLRLVVCIARRYVNRGLQFSDLIEEGNLGLIHAVDKFDPKVGARFSTYATWWIRQSIERALMNQSRQIRLPVHMAKKMKMYLKSKHKLLHQMNREATLEELAQAMEYPINSLKELVSYDRQEISLDASINEEQDTSLVDTLPDERNRDPIDILEEQDIYERLESSLQHLSKRDLEILQRRYGIHNTSVMTLEELGERYDMTRERVRQIQLQALKQLKRRYTDSL